MLRNMCTVSSVNKYCASWSCAIGSRTLREASLQIMEARCATSALRRTLVVHRTAAPERNGQAEKGQLGDRDHIAGRQGAAGRRERDSGHGFQRRGDAHLAGGPGRGSERKEIRDLQGSTAEDVEGGLVRQ